MGTPPLEPSFGKHEYAPFSYQSNIFTLWIAKCDVQGPPWTLYSRARIPQGLPEGPCGPNMDPQDLPWASWERNMSPQDTPKAPPNAPEHLSGPLKSKRSTCLKLENGAL